MEQKLSCARHDDGVPRLPPGFRFHPTDEELVVQYLKRKAFSCPLPAAIIPDIDLGKHDPWELLPGGAAGCAGERYFFNLREAKYPKGNRSNRAASSGYWKATGKDKEIVSSSRCGQAVVGMKKVLVFYRGKPPTGSRTDWIMHEYRLAGAGAGAIPQRKNPTTQTMVVPSCDWVLCRIFKKKRATRTDVEPEGEEDSHGQEEEVLHRNVSDIGFIDFMGRRGNLRSSTTGSSESSCVTETSDGSIHGEEASSA